MGARFSASCSSSSLISEPVPPLPPLTSVPPPTTTPTLNAKDQLNNPGDYEDIGKKLKEQLLPTCIEGAKMVIQKGLSNHLQTMHTLTLGSSTQPSQWQYGATYVGTSSIGENEYRPVMIGDMSSLGNFTALFLHQYGPWKMKVNTQTERSKWVGYQGTMDYMGRDFTASVTLANPDVISGSGVMVLQYLQSMTNRLALGSELVYQRSGGMQGAMISVGGYYRAQMWEASARLGLHSWNINYHQKLDDNFLLLASVDGNLMQNETSACIGYKLDIGGMTMRGKVSSRGIVSATLEKRLDPLPASLMLSGKLYHWTDDSKFGIAVVVG